MGGTMSVKWEAVGAGYPQVQADDELLIVISSSESGAQDSWIIDLEQEAVSALSFEIEYLKAFVGFKECHKKPFVVVRWTRFDTSHLEKRWLLGQMLKRLRVQFDSIKKYSTFLCGSSVEAWQLVAAEDIFLSFYNHNYDDLNLETARVLVKNLQSIKSADPYYQQRFNFHKSFRQWVNEEPDLMTSLEIGKRLCSFAKEHNCQFIELKEDELKKEGLNLLCAVGQASNRSPSRLFILLANRDLEGDTIALVGKGITFDTGGINVKPYEGFVNAMKNDMGGAALMSNLFMALVKSGYDQPLALVIPACENLVAERSMKPGAIYKSHKGLSVSVDHTDAEGRLILADAISYAEKLVKPKLTMVAATLTTASLRQFTGYQTPVHFATQAFQESLGEVSKRYGEQFIFHQDFLPYKWANKGKVSDLTNMGRLPCSANIGGGSNVAAHFLREFANQPLIHFDIFASTWNWSRDYPGSTFGSTGAAFNSLYSMLMSGQGV